MNISDRTAEGFVNTDRLENALVHIINEKKDSEKGPLSYIDTRLFVKKFMDNYKKQFTRSINACYNDTYNNIFSDIVAIGLDEEKHLLPSLSCTQKGDQNNGQQSTSK